MATTVNMAVERTVSKEGDSKAEVFDGHFKPKNEGLQKKWEEMEQKVDQMRKLIGHIGEKEDTLKKKAEMFYEKKPELEGLVEDFYKNYRSLAWDYDRVILRRGIQSEGSCISDVSSEPPSSMPSPDRRPRQHKSGPRAAGFESFLGAGGNVTDQSNEDGDETSTLDSKSESDDSSAKSYAPTQSSDDDQGLRLRIIELEVELRDVKEKLQMAQEGSKNEKSEILLARIAVYEEKLKIAREKIRASEEQISILQDELQKYKLMDFSNIVQGEVDTVQGGTSIMETSSKVDKQVAVVRELNVGSDAVVDSELKIQALEEELKLTKDKLLDSQDIHINEMSTRLYQIRMKNVDLTAKAELADKRVEMLRSKVKELERADMRQHELILELKEEKREAIRQLCFSLEHYRNGYHWLRQAVIGQKPVMAS